MVTREDFKNFLVKQGCYEKFIDNIGFDFDSITITDDCIRYYVNWQGDLDSWYDLIVKWRDLYKKLDSNKDISETKVLYMSKLTFANIKSIVEDCGYTIKLDDCYLCLEYITVASNKSFGSSPKNLIGNGKQGTVWLQNDKSPIKLGKILKHITDLEATEIEKVVNLWKSTYEINTDSIEITTHISRIYDLKHASRGTISRSCMRGCGSYYEWADDHEEIAIAYIKKDDTIIGRALLWSPENSDKKYMDRVYFDSEITKLIFLKWGEDNGYVTKEDQKWDNFYVNNVYLEDGSVPYMDSLKHYDDSCNTLNIYNTSEYFLEGTDGYFEGVFVCDVCGCRVDENTSVYSDYHGMYICSSCLDSYMYCIDACDYIHYNDCFYCVTNEAYYKYENELVYIDGSYYHMLDEDVRYCSGCEEYFLSSDRDYTYNSDGDLICKSCYEAYIESN